MILPKNKKKILDRLLRDMNKEGHNINQIARELKISVGSAFKILKELTKDKIINETKIGNGFFYTLNFKSIETKLICELILINQSKTLTGNSKLYAESLKEFKDAEMIILFGSILKNKEFNDVDVLFLTDRIKEVNAFCLDLTKVRTKPVVPLIIAKKDMIVELKNSKDALLSIVKEGVVLKGESSFIEVIENAKI